MCARTISGFRRGAECATERDIYSIMDTATRRRVREEAQPAPDRLIEAVSAYLPPDSVKLVREAYSFAAGAHEGQQRLTGDPYIVHPLDAAMTVAGLQLDGNAVAAALLHDVQEDCGVPNEELKKRFGPDVAKLVDGVTK